MGQTSSRLGADPLSKRDNCLGALEPLHLSVIIPALRAVGGGASLEVLVVDGGSTDDTVQQAQGLGAKVSGRSGAGAGSSTAAGALHEATGVSSSTATRRFRPSTTATSAHPYGVLQRTVASAGGCGRLDYERTQPRSQLAPEERVSPGSGDALGCGPAPARPGGVSGGGAAAGGATCELLRDPTACKQPLRLGAEHLKGSGISSGCGGTSRSGTCSASGGSSSSGSSRHGGGSDRVSGDALGVVRCTDMHRGAVPGLWAVRRPASPCAGEDGCGGRNRATWPTWGAFASIDTDLRNPLLRTALSAAVQLRTRVFSRPYGDQALFVRRDVLEACGGFAEWPLLEDLDLVTRLSQERPPAIVDAHIRTSGRRWQSVGFLRTTALNQVILAAYALGVSPETLADWYQNGKRAMGA